MLTKKLTLTWSMDDNEGHNHLQDQVWIDITEQMVLAGKTDGKVEQSLNQGHIVRERYFSDENSANEWVNYIQTNLNPTDLAKLVNFAITDI